MTFKLGSKKFLTKVINISFLFAVDDFWPTYFVDKQGFSFFEVLVQLPSFHLEWVR